MKKPKPKVGDHTERFTSNAQIKSALVRIAELKKQISDLTSENEALKQRIRLLEAHLNK